MLVRAHYKKIITLLTLFLLSLGSSEASTNTLLHCLGREELQIHRSKTSGPLTELNKTLVNEIVSIGNIELGSEALEYVCQKGNKFSPSLRFLKVALLRGEKIFIRSKDQNDPLESLKDASIRGFMDDVPHIFFKYLSALQGLSSYSQCLFTQISELKYYLERFHYLEEDFPVTRLIEDKERIKRIFKDLERLDEIFEECELLQKTIKEGTAPRTSTAD